MEVVSTGPQASRNRSGAAMMNHSGHLREEPIMRNRGKREDEVLFHLKEEESEESGGGVRRRTMREKERERENKKKREKA